MSDRQVDPGALLIAVLAVGAVAVTDTGAWTITDSLVSGTALIVVCGYLLPNPGRTLGPRLALFVVLVLCWTITLAWLVQRLKYGDDATDAEADLAALRAVPHASGAALALVLSSLYMARRMRSRIQPRRTIRCNPANRRAIAGRRRRRPTAR